jgi:hypothetical protein
LQLKIIASNSVSRKVCELKVSKITDMYMI